MGFRESFDVGDRTHRVITRRSVSADEEQTGWIAVENTVVDIAMQYGTAVHICIDGGMLDNFSPETLTTVRRLTRLRKSETLLANGANPEYRATLPEDADTVRECLVVDHETPAGPGSWRVFGIHEFAVVHDDTWLYRSVPHHMHIRDINAAADGFLHDVDDALGSIRGAAVFPVGPLVSWESGGRQYELTPEYFRVDSGEGRSGFSLSRLTTVYSNPERLELVPRWSGPPETDSLAVRGLQRISARLSTNPPTRIGVPDRETFDDVLDALRMVATKLDYEFTIHE